ncbi:MAG: phosphoenolpyruvate carboxylase, partial [Tsuneonella sp.]
MRGIADLVARLGELHLRTRETPLFNPVFQLSLDLSRQLESGEIGLADVEALVAELECDALQSRARHLRALVAPVRESANGEALARCLEEGDFGAFCAQWSQPQLHAVFTAHPTFLLTPVQSEAVAGAAAADEPIGTGACTASQERPAVTLDYEHARAMQAIANAHDARDRIVAQVLETARSRWPDRWCELDPLPFRFASWVGYDMDGRTDIAWTTSVGFRLSEKAERLRGYAEKLAAIDP